MPADCEASEERSTELSPKLAPAPDLNSPKELAKLSMLDRSWIFEVPAMFNPPKTNRVNFVDWLVVIE